MEQENEWFYFFERKENWSRIEHVKQLMRVFEIDGKGSKSVERTEDEDIKVLYIKNPHKELIDQAYTLYGVQIRRYPDPLPPDIS